MKTKPVAATLATMLVPVMLAACGTPGGAEADTDGPIKVAIIPPATGALAEFGADAAKAWQFAAEEFNEAGGLDGRQVELIELDTDSTPAATLRAAREAVTQHGAQFIGGVMTSTEHGALNAQLEGLGVLSFNSMGKDDALTGSDCNANAFRAVQSSVMDINALADTIQDLPGERWAIQAVDYSTGHSAAEKFTEAAEQAGKQVVLEQFAPLNTTEFGTYITRLNASDADALFAVEYGADAIAFVNQSAQFNLNERFETVLGMNMVSEQTFPALGDKIVGFYNNVGYSPDLEAPLNDAFVDRWKAEYDGEAPYYVEADTYLAAQTLFEGMKEADSADPMEVREALEGLTFDSIVGEVTMRAEDHQLIRPSYVGQVVEEDDGNLKFELISTSEGEDIMPPVSPDCSL